MNSEMKWERVTGYPTELKIDARWLLKSIVDDITYGSLRIVSHPDLKPGYLRAHLQIVNSITPKTKGEILQMIHDYNMKEIEMEVYSVNKNYDVDTKIFEDTKKKLEELFNVKIFE